MRVELCKRCGMFLDVTGAPDNVKEFYCDDKCAAKPLKKKKVEETKPIMIKQESPVIIILPLIRRSKRKPLSKEEIQPKIVKKKPFRMPKKPKKGWAYERWTKILNKEKREPVMGIYSKAKLYRNKSKLPPGTWVTIEEASEILKKSQTAIRARIGKDQYNLAKIVDGPLLLDLKSYEKKQYTRKEIQ
jgi:hypothetical protein